MKSVFTKALQRSEHFPFVYMCLLIGIMYGYAISLDDLFNNRALSTICSDILLVTGILLLNYGLFGVVTRFFLRPLQRLYNAIEAERAFKMAILLLVFVGYEAGAQSCNCNEYIYLNDPNNNSVHKFRISTTGIMEIGSPWVTGISQPHGLGIDVNGNVYIGEFDAAYERFSINKLTCTGTFVNSAQNSQVGDWFVGPASDYGATAPYSFNFASKDGILYANGGQNVFALDLCNATEIGCVSTGASSDIMWGMALNNEGNLVYTNGWRTSNNDVGILPTALSSYTSPTCMAAGTLIADNFVAEDPGNGNFNQVYGVTHAADGNYYVVVTENTTPTAGGGSLGTSRIYRVTPAGVTTLIATDNANNGTGFYATRGIVYSESAGYLFLSAYENCIYAMDLNGNPAPAQFINTTPGFPKGIAIATECCPTATPVTVTESACFDAPGQKFFLAELTGSSCNGSFCANGNAWTANPGNNANLVFNACDNSVTVNGVGCGSFTLTNPGGGNACGAFSFTVNLCLNAPPAATFTQTAPTCTGTTANNNGIITFATAANVTRFGLSTAGAATYDGPVYASATAFTAVGQNVSTAIPNTGGTYIVRVFNGGAGCFTDVTVTVAAVSCIAVSCDCDEYLYLNDDVNGMVHKFRINDGTGALTEIGSPWLSGGISLPHGIAMDPNGYLYIAEINPTFTQSIIKKLSVDGVIIDNNWMTLPYPILNFFGKPEGLYVYSVSTSEVTIFDWCTKANIGCMTTNVYGAWGFSKSLDENNFYIAEGSFNGVERLHAGSTALSAFSAPVCAPNTTSVVVDPTTLSGATNSTMGVTTDEDGNYYVTIGETVSGSGGPGLIKKFSPAGVELASTPIDNVNDNVGWFGARGIIYSETSKYLYVSSSDDCIAVFDRDLNYISSLSIPFVPGSLAKAIGIVTECCVSPQTSTITQAYCDPQVGDRILLRDFLPCGNLPAGSYSISGGNIGTYNSCDQSITLTTTTGSTTFTYNRPASANNTCGATTITVQLNLSSSPVATFTQTPPTCTGAAANNNGIITFATATNATHFGISTAGAATYNGPAYPATTFTAVGQNVSTTIPNTGGAYIVRVFNGSAGCFTDVSVTVAAVSCAAASCDCDEYIYLNDDVNGIVHKFRVNDGTGALAEIGSPWLPGGISLPHGIAMDPNGYVYIAEINPTFTQSIIKKLTVDGVIVDANWMTLPYPILNFFGKPEGLYVYSVSTSEVTIFDWCTKANIGCMTTNVYGAWGFAKSVDDNNFYIAEGSFNSVERLHAGATALSGFSAPVCAPNSTTVVVDPTTPSGATNSTMGVTTDEDGNYYVTISQTPSGTGGAALIKKFSPAGVEIGSTSLDNINDNVGWFGARGIIYSETSKYLYVSSMDDCIAVFDRDLTYYPTLSVPFVPGSQAKAIGIVTECCVSPQTSTITQAYCDPQVGDRILLRDFLPCDNIAAGNYTISGGNIGTYNSCDQSITLTTTTGSTTFTYNRPASANNTCGATTITVNLNLTAPPTATFTQTAPTCTGATANNNGIITFATATGVTNFGISTAGAAMYDGPAYPAITFTAVGQNVSTAIPNTGGAYIVRVFNGGAACFTDVSVTVAAVSCFVACTPPVLTVNNSTICAGNSTSLVSLVTGNAPAGTLSFHATQADADANTNALLNTTVAPAVTTTYYVRSEVTGTCYSTASITVTVSANPNPTVTNGTVCGGGSIDLSTLVSNAGGTLSYYSTYAHAVAGTPSINAVVSPTVATNYYVRSTNAAGCYTIKEMVITMQPQGCSLISVSGPN